MKKLSFILIFSVVLFSNAFGKQWIVFYAEKSNAISKTPFTAPLGHAFASFIQEDVFSRQTKLVGCWGFYPEEITLKTLWGAVPSALRPDWKTRRDYSFLVEVSAEEFNHCLRIKDLYDKKLPYSLVAQNCTNFIRDLIGAIPKLTPPDKKIKLPENVLQELKRKNSLIERESAESFDRSIGNASNPKMSEWSDDLANGSLTINPDDVTLGTDKAFKWYDWDKAPEALKTAFKYIHTFTNRQTSKDEILLTEVDENIEQNCNVKVAAVDLDGDGVFGVALFATGGTYCCGTQGCYFRLYEKGGLSFAPLGITEEVFPAVNGVRAGTGNFFALKPNTQINVDETEMHRLFTYKKDK